MEIECQKCGWIGDPSECVCSDADANSDKKVSQIKFDKCPNCGADDFKNVDGDDEEESFCSKFQQK